MDRANNLLNGSFPRRPVPLEGRTPVRPASRAVALVALALAAFVGLHDGRCAPPPPLRHLLFDFEQGVSGWVGNPWGGGASGAEAEPAAALGSGSLCAWYRDVPRGATVIAPEFPANASWRDTRWGGISLYVRGDGSPDTVKVHLATRAPEGLLWSRSLALENRTWHRVYLPFATFWNRQGKRLDPAKLQRLYFGGRGTHRVWIDQIRLEAPHQVQPLENERRTPQAAPGVGPAWLDFGSGLYAARFNASRLQEANRTIALEVRLRTGTMEMTARDEAPAGQARQRELFAVLPRPVANEGPAIVSLTVRADDGKLVVRRTGNFRVFLPPGRPEEFSLPLIPVPKETTSGSGTLRLRAAAAVYVAGLPATEKRPLRLLARTLENEYGIRVRTVTAPGEATVRLYHTGGKTSVQVPNRLAEFATRVTRRYAAEGYVLQITPAGVDVVAAAAHGLYNGLQSFLQLLRADTPAADAPQVRSLTVVDWPSTEWRALTMTLPTDRWGHPNNAPVDSAFYCDFIRRFVARRKFNAVALGINAGFQFASHPEIAGPAAWTRQELGRVVKTCRENFIEPIPFVNSYGHTGWLNLRHPELREDGDLNTLCVRNPETFKVLTDLYSELIGLFEPIRFFHVGMDEIRWKTLKVAPEKRCKLCAGVPKYQLVAEHIRRLHDWLAAHGARTMIWGDMLLPEHNGGPPFHTARALPLLPRDIIVANWSTSLAPDSNVRFNRLGFTVWQSNSRGVNRAQAAYCVGNMFGSWTKTPWWADAPWRSGQRFNFLSFPIAAQYSWNLWPDVRTLQPGLTADRLARMLPGWIHEGIDPVPSGTSRTFALVLPLNFSSKAATPPDPAHWFGAGPAHDLAGLPRGKVYVGGMPFQMLRTDRDCLRPPPDGGEVELPVGRRVSELRFLHTAYVPPERRKALDEGFKRAENWRGIPVGRYTIRYADGSRDELVIRYIANIKRWDEGDRIPYLARSAGFLIVAAKAEEEQEPSRKNACLYVAQWVNPHPEKKVTAVRFTAGPDAPAIPVLFAVSGRGVRAPPVP